MNTKLVIASIFLIIFGCTMFAIAIEIVDEYIEESRPKTGIAFKEESIVMGKAHRFPDIKVEYYIELVNQTECKVYSLSNNLLYETTYDSLIYTLEIDNL